MFLATTSKTKSEITQTVRVSIRSSRHDSKRDIHYKLSESLHTFPQTHSDQYAAPHLWFNNL